VGRLYHAAEWCANERSPDNGLLTPAMKLARPVIARQFAKEIEKSYGRAL
jgi:long-subunit acyl-CoA synthetase (AMP-forming)